MTDIKGYLATLTNLVGGYEDVAADYYKDCAQILMPPKKKSPKSTPNKTRVKVNKKDTDKTVKDTDKTVKDTDKTVEDPPKS